MENEGILNKTVTDFSKKSSIIQTIIIALLALLVPTFLGQLITLIFGATSVIASNSQIIVGSIVNTALIVSAINLKGWQNLVLVITMPSVSTMLSGYVFHSASPLLAYMIPAIWVGNFALVFAFKYIMLAKEKHYFLAGIIGIAVKVVVIFGVFSILNAFKLFPDKVAQVLQTAMGTTQLITATIGTVISYIIYLAEKKNKKIEE